MECAPWVGHLERRHQSRLRRLPVRRLLCRAERRWHRGRRGLGCGRVLLHGPWGFSVTYFHGENVDDENPFADEELDQFLVGAYYKIAKGVMFNAYGAYLEFDEDVSDGGGGTGDDIDAFVIGTAIRLDF